MKEIRCGLPAGRNGVQGKSSSSDPANNLFWDPVQVVSALCTLALAFLKFD